MDEEEKPKETTEENTDEGLQPESTKLIDDANSAAERLETANKKQEELLNKQEQIMAKQALAGRADAGQQSEKKEEVSDTEYAKMFREGKIPLTDVLK